MGRMKLELMSLYAPTTALVWTMLVVPPPPSHWMSTSLLPEVTARMRNADVALCGSVPARYSCKFEKPSPSSSRAASVGSCGFKPCASSHASGIPSPSASTGTSTATVAELFPRFGSGNVPETVAVFENVPDKVGVTTILRAVVAFEAIEPKLQMTVVPFVTQLPEAETNVRLAGSASVTVTPVALAPPKFETTSEKVV